MIVEDYANVGEETHIWKDDELLFEGKYKKNNPYAKRKVCGVGYEEEIGSYPEKWWRAIELE